MNYNKETQVANQHIKNVQTISLKKILKFNKCDCQIEIE